MAEYYRRTAKKCPKYEQMHTDYNEVYMRACQFCKYFENNKCSLNLLKEYK